MIDIIKQEGPCSSTGHLLAPGLVSGKPTWPWFLSQPFRARGIHALQFRHGFWKWNESLLRLKQRRPATSATWSWTSSWTVSFRDPQAYFTNTTQARALVCKQCLPLCYSFILTDTQNFVNFKRSSTVHHENWKDKLNQGNEPWMNFERAYQQPKLTYRWFLCHVGT